MHFRYNYWRQLSFGILASKRHAIMLKNGSEMKKIIVLAVIVLAGCASSGPVQTGKDTYMIAKTSAGGMFVSGAQVKAELIQEGSAHCAKSGKALELINGEGKNGIPFARQTSAEISFKCV
jgi:hypothetical protein